MNELTTRKALILTINDMRSALDEAINAVDESSALEPETFGMWSFKDLLAHLTAWRENTAIRLEAAKADVDPQAPWPDDLSEDDNVDDVNFWLYERDRDKSLDMVVRESNANFDRIERALNNLSEEELFTPSMFHWLTWTTAGIGPALIGASRDHQAEHMTEIDRWLAEP